MPLRIWRELNTEVSLTAGEKGGKCLISFAVACVMLAPGMLHFTVRAHEGKSESGRAGYS